MQTIQAIAAEAFAASPMVFLKDRAEADTFAANMQADAGEGEVYEVRAYQGGRFVVALMVDGKFAIYL